MNCIISKDTADRIYKFYYNVSIAHPNTFSKDEVDGNIRKILRSLRSFRPDNSRHTTQYIVKNWQDAGWKQAGPVNKWFFAYTVDKSGNVIIEDAEHSQNIADGAMHGTEKLTIIQNNIRQANSEQNKSDTVNSQFKPRDIGYGYTKVKSKSGLYAVADKDGKPLSDGEWFKEIRKMGKNSKGEIFAVVNVKGMAYVYFPKKEKDKRIVNTGKSWNDMFSESAFNKAFGEALNELCGRKTLTESYGPNDAIDIDEDDLKELIHDTISMYEDFKQNYTDDGTYEVVPGDELESRAPSLENERPYRKFALYYSPEHTYCLMRWIDNKKFFFTEIVDAHELGDGQTKYEKRKIDSIPDSIIREVESRLRKRGILRN